MYEWKKIRKSVKVYSCKSLCSRQGDDAAPRLAGEEPAAGVEHVWDDVWRLRMDELMPGAEESCTVEWGVAS